MARSHVAWSNSTPLSLLSSSFDQSSICRGIPIQVEGQSQNESLFLSQELTHKRSYSLLIRPASSSCLDQSYQNVPKKFVQGWNSPSGPPSAFRSDQRLEEPNVSLQLNPHFPTRDLALEASQQKAPIAPLNHDFPYKVQNIPNLVAALSPVPQQSGPRELLPPIELSDREDHKDSEGSATIFFDYACHKYPCPYDDVQRYEFSPAQTTCEGLGIFSDSSERGFPCEDEMQPIGRQSSFGSSIGYPGVTLESAVDRCRIITPRRRLSYGEHLQTPESKSLHRTAGFRELRHTIGCSTTADDYAPSFRGISSTDRPQHLDECPVPPRSKPRLRIDTFGTSKRRQTPKSKPDSMEASSSKPRLWIAPDHDDQVSDAYWSKQAQTKVHVGNAHLETMSSHGSPSVISVAGQNSKFSSKTSTPDQPPKPVSAFSPYTPPETPHSLQKQKHNLDVPNDQPSYPITPPSSCLATPQSKDTLQRIPTASPSEVSLTDGSSPSPTILSTASQRPSPTGTSVRPLNESIERVLNEVERSTSGFSAVRLQLSSPCIQAIRLSSSEEHPPVFSQPSVNGPYSGYTSFSPLGSHPANAAPGSPPCSTGFNNSTPARPGDPTLSALHEIFPNAPTLRLDSLQATYLALHYLSTIFVPLRDNSPTMPKIVPKKACKTLGLPLLTPVRISARKTSQWTRERVERLAVGLRMSLVCLVSEIEGKRGGKNNGLLMKALGEVVRMGEGTWAERGSDDLGGIEMWNGKVTEKESGKESEEASGKSPAAYSMRKKRSMRNIFEEL